MHCTEDMTPTMSTSSSGLSSEALFVGAEWAIAHGDAGGLSQVLADLACLMGPPLRADLLALAALCHNRYEVAAESWLELRDRVRSELSARRRRTH
jgi:hypothetical protein